MADQEQDPSEAPTRFKLDRARSKGSVARGLDLSFMTGLIAFLGFLWVAGASSIRTLTREMHDALITGGQLAEDRGAVVAMLAEQAGAIERPLALMAGTIFAIVLLLELLQTGLVFTSEPMRLDFSRLNPAKGLKRLFTRRALVETGKSVLKLAVYAAVASLTLRSMLQTDIASLGDAPSLARIGAATAIRMLIAFAGTALLFATLDQIIARRDFLKRMRMSRREVKQELRDREGEPRLKQKRKQMHAAFSRDSRSIRGLRDADMLIVNPEHVAIALSYDALAMDAPVVVSIGIDALALRLKRLALLYQVAVVEDRSLVRALLKGAALGRAIAPAHYRPIADLYNRLNRERRQRD